MQNPPAKGKPTYQITIPIAKHRYYHYIWVMRLFYTLLLSLGLLMPSFGQVISHQHITPLGGDLSSPEFQMSISVGELTDHDFNKDSCQLGQGFIHSWQYNMNTNGNIPNGIQPMNSTLNLKLFPNPTSGTLLITTSEALQTPITLQLFDLEGSLILTSTMPPNTTQKQIELNHVSSGTYVLTSSTQQANIPSFKIQLYKP